MTRGDVVLIAILGLAGLGLIVFLYRGLVAVAVDEEAARASGVPVAMINVCLAALAGVTVAISMRIVGILLIAALMALPVMTASRIANSLRSALLLSIALGCGVAVAGVVLAYYLDLAAGGAIVLLAVLVFTVTVLIQAAGARARAPSAPAPLGSRTRRAPSSGRARRAASSAPSRRPPARRAPGPRGRGGRGDGVGAEGERLEHVGAGADAAVEEDRQLVADRLGDRRQGVERGDRAVDLAAAVVGDDDPVDPAPRAPRGRRRGAGCP